MSTASFINVTMYFISIFGAAYTFSRWMDTIWPGDEDQ